MKKLITIIAVSLLTINAQAQYGGVIRAVNNSNVIGEIQRIGASMKVHDTALVNIQTAMKLKTDSIYTRLGSGVGVSSIPPATQTTLEDISVFTGSIDAQMTYLFSLKLKTDSIYRRMYQDSVNLAKLGTGVTTTLDSTTQRSTIKISNFPATQPVSLSGNVNTTISGITKKTLGTAVVSADTGLVVNALIHGLTTGGGGGYVDVKVNPSGALTVDATLDSTTQRGTMKISNFPATQAVSGTIAATQSGTWNINNVSGTVSLPTGAATETTSSGILSELIDQGSNYASKIKLKTDSIYTRLGTGVTVNSHPVTNAGTFAVQVDSSTQRRGVVIIGGSITATAGATGQYDSTWVVVNMDTAGLAAKANSATVGWQSDSVGIRQHKATDVEIGVKISMANTTPANDKAVYIYIAPWWYNGSTWYSASGGTITQLSGANSSYTIATPNNLRLLGVLSYTTQNMVLQDVFTLSSIFARMPDAFSIVVVNFSGAAIHTSGNEITYNLMNKVQR